MKNKKTFLIIPLLILTLSLTSLLMNKGNSKIIFLEETNKKLASNGCIIFSPDVNVDKENLKANVFLIDKEGLLKQKWTIPGRVKVSKLDQDGNLWVAIIDYGKNVMTEMYSKIMKLSWEGEIIYEMEIPGMHHDFDIINQDTIVTVVFSNRKVKLPNLDPNNNDYYSEELIELNLKSKKTTFRFDLLDKFDKDSFKKLLYAQKLFNSLWHINSIRYYKEDPLFGRESFLITSRNLSQVALFSRDNSELLWISKKGLMQKGHDGHLLKNGDLLFFNNAIGSNIVTQVNSKTFEQVWSYSDSIQFFNQYQGAAQRLENGNTFITNSLRGHMFEVNKDSNEVVFSIVSKYHMRKGKSWPYPKIFKATHYTQDYFNKSSKVSCNH